MYGLIVLLATDIIVSIIRIISNRLTLKEINNMISELSKVT